MMQTNILLTLKTSNTIPISNNLAIHPKCIKQQLEDTELAKDLLSIEAENPDSSKEK